MNYFTCNHGITRTVYESVVDFMQHCISKYLDGLWTFCPRPRFHVIISHIRTHADSADSHRQVRCTEAHLRFIAL